MESWLLRIVSRKSIDRIRARAPHNDIADHDAPDDEARSPSRQVEARSREQALERALAELPAQQRQSWLLKEMCGPSYDKIAEQLAVPPSTVKGALVRARKTLIREMGEWR